MGHWETSDGGTTVQVVFPASPFLKGSDLPLEALCAGPLEGGRQMDLCLLATKFLVHAPLGLESLFLYLIFSPSSLLNYLSIKKPL